MTNAEMATKLVINYLEAEHIIVATEDVIKIVNKWESKLDPIDFISLAAVSIANPPNQDEFSNSEVRNFREFFFSLKTSF